MVATVSRTSSSAPRRRLFPREWPLCFALLGYPVSWALGMGALIWPAFAVPMAGRLIMRRRTVRAPKGFGLWVLFVVWTFISAVNLQQALPIAFLWRASNYLSMTVFLLYVFNTPREQLPTSKVVGWLSGFWLITVAGGWLGVLLPYGQFTSPLELVMPRSLGNQEFLRQIIHPTFAQVQNFLGYPLGRPNAPFDYTNTWGSVYSLTIPFFFLAWLQSPHPTRRRNAYLLLTLSLVPVFLSLNRGLWLGLLVALFYGAARPGEIGRIARRTIVVLLVIGAALLILTPLKTVVAQRADNPNSNVGRTFLYEQNIQAVLKSPFIGYGGPRPYGGPKLIPQLGTQGHFWLVLYSQGIVGIILFSGFLLKMIWSTRHGPVTTFWCHAMMVIAVVQLFVYDMIPAPLHLVFIAAGLGAREALDAAGDPEGGDRPDRAAPELVA